MTNAATLQARASAASASFPSCAHSADQQAQHFVGEGREPASDEEREEAIRWAGAEVIEAYGRKEAARRRYAASSCLTDRADMDAEDMRARSALRLMEALIRGRSQAQVARMERERGIA